MKKTNRISTQPITETINGQEAPLTDSEQKQLTDCEEQIDSGTALAAMALKTIHDQKLYREEYKTWEKYLEERWEMGGRYSHQLLFFATVHGLVKGEKCANGSHFTLPSSERQVRPLTRLNNDAQIVAVWAAAVERAGGKQPSGALVQEVADQIFPVERLVRKPKVPASQAIETEATDDTLEQSLQEDTELDAKNNGIVTAAEESPDEAENAGMVETASIGLADSPSLQDVPEVGQTEADTFADSGEDVAEQVNTREEEPALPISLTITPSHRKAAGGTKRVHELTVAFRDAIADEMDAKVAERIYDAVQGILAEMQQAA